jgi:transcription initiation factor TFIIA small subunit
MSCTAGAGTAASAGAVLLLTSYSLGGALTDTLDNLITERRIEPQLAMKILANFDKAVAEVLADKVKARLSFKVGYGACCPQTRC